MGRNNATRNHFRGHLWGEQQKQAKAIQEDFHAVPHVSSWAKLFEMGPEKKDKQLGGERENTAAIAPDITPEAQLCIWLFSSVSGWANVSGFMLPAIKRTCPSQGLIAHSQLIVVVKSILLLAGMAHLFTPVSLLSSHHTTSLTTELPTIRVNRT